MRITRTTNILLLAGSYGGLLLFLLSTNPSSMPAGLLILPSAWFMLSSLLLVEFLLRNYSRGSLGNSTSKRLLYSTTIAALPSLLLVMSSINQLTLKDVLLFVSFLSVAGLYINKLQVRPSSDIV